MLKERETNLEKIEGRRVESPILYGLKAIYSPFTLPPNVSLGEILVSRIIQGSIKPIALVGAPGLGKTTAANELDKELDFWTHGDCGLGMHFFDKGFRETENQIGKRKLHEENGTEKEFWLEVNKKIVEDFRKRTPRKNKRHPIEIKALELPLCGDQDRGVTALARLFRTSSTQLTNHLIVGFIPENPDQELSKTQLRAGRLRKFVSVANPEDALNILKDNGITIENTHNLDPVTLGEQIKTIFSRMAEEERIKDLNDEMIREVRFMSTDLKYIRDNILPREYHDSPYALHMAYTLLRKARVSESKFMLVTNPYLDNSKLRMSLDFLKTEG